MECRTKKLITFSISSLLVGHVLLFYALPIKIFVIVFIALALFFLLMDWQNIIMVSVSLAIGTLIFSGFLKVSGINKSVYYRPHEMFSVADSGMTHGIYQKDVDFEMEMPHGDLRALALYEKVTLEPRQVTFKTDSLGFRNSSDYHGQKYLLVGDSFIAGSGTTQDDILSQQLLKKHDFDGYNLAHPGGVDSYINFIKTFDKHFDDTNKVVLFLFEGNDFMAPDVAASEDSYIDGLKSYFRIFNKTDIYRFMYSHTSRYSLKKKEKKKVVDTHIIEGVPVSFYKKYAAVSERDFVLDNPEIEKNITSIKDRIAYVFFIPTKYRVYYEHIAKLNSSEMKALPNKQWELVQQMGKKHGIPVMDLTPALIIASNKLLKKGELTFWQDDTHWNGNGISIAAEVVAKSLGESL